MVSRGEVWWVEEPDVGRRPHLVLTRDLTIPVLNEIIAVPATRTVRGIQTEVPLSEDDGMPDRCVLLVDKVKALPKSQFVGRITKLRPERVHEVCLALSKAVECRT